MSEVSKRPSKNSNCKIRCRPLVRLLGTSKRLVYKGKGGAFQGIWLEKQVKESQLGHTRVFGFNLWIKGSFERLY